MFDAEDDEEDDGGRQRIELQEGSISLDQVRCAIFRVITPLYSSFAGKTNCYAECMEGRAGLNDFTSYTRLSFSNWLIIVHSIVSISLNPFISSPRTSTITL
jgi:hypothetical protein